MKHSNTIQKVVKFSGLFVALNGLVVIFGWLTHNIKLIQIYSSFPPMHFNTALCFVLCGFALSNIYSRNRLLMQIPALILIVISIMVATEYVTNKNLIDTLFVTPFTHIGLHSGRISSYSLLDFIFASIIFTILSCRHKRFHSLLTITAVLFSSLIVSFALVSLLEFMTGIASEKIWTSASLMSLQSAICFIILGVALILHSFNTSDMLTSLFPIPIFFALLSSVVYISYSVRNYEDLRFEESIHNELIHAASEFSLSQINLYRSLRHMAQRWTVEKGTPQAWFEADAASYLRDYPTLQALTIVDKTYHVLWIVPLEPNKRFVGLDYQKEPIRAATMMKAIATASAQTTPPIRLFSNNAVGFVYMSPLFIDGVFDGMLIAAFNADVSFKWLFEKTLLPNYFLIAREENTSIFSNLSDYKSGNFNGDWTQTTNIIINNKVWTFSLTPKENLIANKNTNVPFIVFLAGFLTSLITALAIYFGMEAKKNANELNVNISKRKQAQAELKWNQEWLQAIMDASHHAIIAVDLTGTIKIFNTAAVKMLGYTAEEIIGKHDPIMFHDPEQVAKRSSELSELIGREIVPSLDTFITRLGFQEVDEQEWTYVRKDRTTLTVWLSITAVYVSGQVKGYVGIAQDISERKVLEALKNEFISIVSHELRTPITSIHGVIGLLLGGALGDFTEKAQSMLSIAQSNCERLIRLINDILDMEKIDAGKMEYNIVALDLNQVVEETIQANLTYINNYKVLIKFNRWPAAIMVNADSDRLQQVFTNLISNAVKFSPKNATVTVSTIFENGHGIITFKDCGSGIPDAFQKTIFQKFSQADSTSTRKKGGTGLGLSISKAIIEVLKGTITFLTKMNHGTTFIVSLPGRETKE